MDTMTAQTTTTPRGFAYGNRPIIAHDCPAGIANHRGERCDHTAYEPVTGGVVDCQDDDTHGTHEATYSHTNEYGQRIYTVACGAFIERYTDEVVRKG
jgi:hypothetical protein